MSDVILSVRDLKKTYHQKNGSTVEAVKGISFDVKRGEVFGFLGANGAGKSTTISMLTTQLKTSGGDATIDGISVVKDPVKVRSKIGVVAQHNNLDRSLTAKENLLFHARYFGMDMNEARKKADDYLEKFGLAERQNDYVSSYSGGMAQRLKIARAMMHTPEILFLDEPTTGLDPNYREILWEQMMELNRQGTTIFLTTHYMEEPERFCENIAIVNKGELRAMGTSEELKAMIPSKNIISLKLDKVTDLDIQLAAELPNVEKTAYQGGTLQLYLKDRQPDFDSIIKWTEERGRTLKNISLSTSTLDDVFLYLTGDVANGPENQ
ncbi:MAG: ATP-binding cassette domain-containing protein [Coriobacteriales bacterium]|jgi:ABC-2 type transport system ATP-binding protein